MRARLILLSGRICLPKSEKQHGVSLGGGTVGGFAPNEGARMNIGDGYGGDVMEVT